MEAGHDILIIDNYSNSSPKVIERLETLLGRPIASIDLDVTDGSALDLAVSQYRPDAVIHFAGLKSVSESNEQPDKYYQVNVAGTLNLLRAMDRAVCSSIVFSSSACVYGEPDYLPIDENHRLSPVNPYGRSKQFVEHILMDKCAADPKYSATILRYFNPVGAHPSGFIGESPNDVPNNLMPFLLDVAAGEQPELVVYGNDYDTRDGSGERDFIHVVDLAEAHVRAVEAVADRGCDILNIGSGVGITVLEMIETFHASTGIEIPYRFASRRVGDAASSIADPKNANNILDWRARCTLEDMCRSAWAWKSANPGGYV